MTEKTLTIIPLGGLGEVGKNMMVLEYGHDILIIDTGLMFPENDMWGVDYIIPDFSYLNDKRDRVRGIVVTHGHEDHTGAIRHVAREIDAPIYGTPLTRGLLEAKLREAKLYKEDMLQTVQAGEKVSIGPFEVESALIEHPSVAEAAVVGKPDRERGQVVKAYIILAPGFNGSDELTEQIQAHVKSVTAPYKYPREIEYVTELPKTISGKIRRVEVREAE